MGRRRRQSLLRLTRLCAEARGLINERPGPEHHTAHGWHAILQAQVLPILNAIEAEAALNNDLIPHRVKSRLTR